MKPTSIAATLALAATVPFLAALQSAPSNEAPKSAPPGAGQQLGATNRQFMNDGTPIKVDEKVMLFNGKDLAGWKAFVPDLAKDGKDPLSVWTVQNGVMQCAGRPIGYIQTEELYDNFILELSWRFDPAKGEGNSGVLLRTIGDDTVWPKSMEAQLHSKNAGDFWNIGEYKATVDAKRTNGRHTVKLRETNEKPLGEWNHYRITVNHAFVSLEVNGQLLNGATEVLEVPGKICLQSEGAEIQFRDVRLTPLP